MADYGCGCDGGHVSGQDCDGMGLWHCDGVTAMTGTLQL